jgi:hypothetical protein
MIDNLIIGAGTAGITISSNLKKGETLVLEKSKFYGYPFFFKVPLFIGLIFNSKYVKLISFKKNDRLIPFYESGVVGGASEINGCVHALGTKDKWDMALEGINLDYEDIYKSYKNIFSYKPKGKQIALRKAHTNQIDELFFSYLDSLDFKHGDMSFSDSQIYGPISINVKTFFRSSVKKLINNSQKKRIKKGVEVYDIKFDDNNNVLGVNTSDGFIGAKNVILSAGAIGTNKILLNTKKKLQKSKCVDPISNKVGHNVQDHPNFRIKVFTHKKFETLNEINNSILLKAKNFIMHFIGKNTFFRATGASSAAYFDFNNDGIVDTKIQIVQFTEKGRLSSDKSKMQFDEEPGFSLAITIIDPKSTGRISLDQAGKINIEPNYFQNSEDIEVAYKAIEFAMKFLNSKMIKDEIKNIENYDLLKSNVIKFINENHYSGYHLIGGCSLKNNGVIGRNLNVKGVNGLYVCDASCFDNHVSSNTHAPVVSLANSFVKELYEF